MTIKRVLLVVGVVSALLSEERRDAFAATNVAEQERLRATHAAGAARRIIYFTQQEVSRLLLAKGAATG